MSLRHFICSRPLSDTPRGEVIRYVRETKTMPDNFASAEGFAAYIAETLPDRECIKWAAALWREWQAVGGGV